MDKRDLSEVVFGLCLEQRIPATMVNPAWFSEPYDVGIEILQKKGATREDVAKVVASSYLNDAHESVKRMNGLGEQLDWPKTLKDAYEASEDAHFYKKIVKQLEENKPVDWLPVYGHISSRIANQSSGLSKASDIKEDNYYPFHASGYDAIDKTIGGIPTDGPIIIYGDTGVGKSTFAINIIDKLLHQYPTKTAAIYTLEMSAEHYKWRAKNMYSTLSEVWDRLYISGSVKDIEELVAEITVKKVDYVVLDDLDNIVKEQAASEYERVFRRVKEVCRFMKIPFFVLCQPNRMSKIATQGSENTRFLTKYDIAWSGAGENSAALLIALQKTNAMDMSAETFPTTDEDMFYMMFWKSRDGWPGNYDNKSQIGPGAAIMLPSKQMWRGTPYSGKWRLWPPTAGTKKMGKSNNKDK